MHRRHRRLHTAEHQSMRMAPFTCALLTLFFISFALQEGKRLGLLVLYPGATCEVWKWWFLWVPVMVLGSKPFVRGPKGSPVEPPPALNVGSFVLPRLRAPPVGPGGPGGAPSPHQDQTLLLQQLGRQGVHLLLPPGHHLGQHAEVSPRNRTETPSARLRSWTLKPPCPPQ